MMTHDERVEQAHELFRHLVQIMLERRASMWADQGLSLPQIRLLFVLAHFGPATINQIADRLHSSQSATSLLVDRLVQARLAERNDDPGDRRRAIVRLTREGEALTGRQRAGILHAWLDEQDDTRLTIMSETFTALLNLTNVDDFFEEGSRDNSSY